MELNPQEKEVLRIFADDKVLFPTIQKIVKERFERDIQETIEDIVVGFKKQEMTNEIAGERLRACSVGVSLVEGIFAELSKHKTPLPKESKINPAR